MSTNPKVSLEAWPSKDLGCLFEPWRHCLSMVLRAASDVADGEVERECERVLRWEGRKGVESCDVGEQDMYRCSATGRDASNVYNDGRDRRGRGGDRALWLAEMPTCFICTNTGTASTGCPG